MPKLNLNGHMKFFRLTMTALLVSVSIANGSVNSQENTPRICEILGWGTDLQAVFPGYRVAVCIGGMNPTHMVVVNDSNISNQKTVTTMLLKNLVSLESVGHEGATTVGDRNGAWASYESQNHGTTYQVDVTADGWTTLTISSGGNTIYSQGSNNVIFVDLVLPKR
jgi:hypothetical protein